MNNWKKIVIFFAIAALISPSIIGISATEGKTRPIRLVAYTPTESMETPSLPMIFEDLRQVKRLGFDGIKLWDTNDLYHKGWLDDVLTDAGGLHLQVNVVFQFPSNQDSFPPSPLELGTMQQTIIAIGSITRTHKDVVWNSLFAPFDWTMSESARKQIVQSQTYRDALEESLRTMRAVDPSHQARIALDFDPTIGFPLLKSAQGYGIMPYDLQQDRVDIQRVVQFIAYFAAENKPVYIDEWGLHTTTIPSHGLVSSETEKSRLLVDFAKIAENLDVDWTYFMLTDRVSSIPFENGVDWGILNMDRSPRESGVSIQAFLLAV